MSNVLLAGRRSTYFGYLTALSYPYVLYHKVGTVCRYLSYSGRYCLVSIQTPGTLH